MEEMKMNGKIAKEIIRSMFPTATLHFGGPGNLFAKYAQVGEKVRSKQKRLIGTGDTWEQVVQSVTKVYTRRQAQECANAIVKSIHEVRATFLLTQ
jgi:hypothetical protein